MMYGTIARLQVQPGMEKQFLALFDEYEPAEMPAGALGTYLYQMDRGTNEYYMAVLFEDEKSYLANAESPEQDARYRKLRAVLAADPEWHDGEVVFSLQRETAVCAV